MPADLWAFEVAVVGGAVIGFLLAVFGGGGSVLATPLLLYGAGVKDAHVAIGTSAAAVSANAVAGLVMQARAGRVKWPCATVFAVAGLAGALTGAAIAKQIGGAVLMIWFAVAMAAVAMSMIWSRAGQGDPDVRLTRAITLKLAPAGAVTGLAAGFFGIGGGFLIAPGLMAATGMTLANAAASSLISVALFGAATSLSYAASGFIDVPLFIALVVGGLIGTIAGAPVARRLASRALLARRIFGGMILVTAAWVAWRSLGA